MDARHKAGHDKERTPATGNYLFAYPLIGPTTGSIRSRRQRAGCAQDRTSGVPAVAVTLAFAWILQPFYGAVLWAVVVAVIFAPVYRKLLARMGDRPSLAAAITVLIIIAIVILPLVMIATSLAKETTALVTKIQSGEYSLGNYLQQVLDALPAWATGLIERFNLTDFSALREQLKEGLLKG